MGYYTKYDLQVIKGNISEEQCKSEICQIMDYRYLFDDAVKWYNHDKTMIDFSSKNPNMILELSGEGEENGDIWKKYYYNGKMIKECRARIVFDEFNVEQYIRDNKLENLLSNEHKKE